QHARPKLIGHMEPLRDQLMSPSSVVVTKPFSVTPSAMLPISEFLASSPRRSREALCPVERALLPFVDEADDEDRKKHHHRHESEPPDFLERDRPRKQEGDLEIEQDEQDRYEVV